MGFKTFLEKYLTTKKIGRDTVEFFSPVTKKEITDVMKEWDGEAKLIYNRKDKKLYLFSDPEFEHKEMVKALGQNMEDVVHIVILDKVIKKIQCYTMITTSEGLQDDFIENGIPMLKKMLPNYKIVNWF
jgi:hypothetical protein